MFARCLTKRALLFTEMVTAKALIYGDVEQLTLHSPEEYPLALQIGGSNPEELAKAVTSVKNLGFSEINLNLGCPSDRVKAGCFGAALMAEPERVSDCIQAMKIASGINGPQVTAKIRLGINDQDFHETLPQFLEMLSSTNIKRVYIHARIAVLGGLSPKQNREVPPLNYVIVHQMKKIFPHIQIILNGGLKTVKACRSETQQLDGAMMGRAAYQNPQELLKVDPEIFGIAPPHTSARDALMAYEPYVDKMLSQGFPLKHISRHLVGLYHEVPGARQYRRILSERAHLPKADWGVIETALKAVSEAEMR